MNLMASERASESGRGDSVPPLIFDLKSIFYPSSQHNCHIRNWKLMQKRACRLDSPTGTEPFLTGVSGGRVLSISSGVTAGPKLTYKTKQKCKIGAEPNSFDRTNCHEKCPRQETNIDNKDS